jgi:hypothetical protein
MTVTLEVLHVPDCPNVPRLLQRLREVTELPVVTRSIRSIAEAEAAGMAGSPTLLVDGRDPFRVERDGGRACGLACRLYRDERGRAVPVPSIAQLRAALRTTTDSWPTRVPPVDPAEKAVHQAILRGFATTGHAPAAARLARLATGAGRAVEEVLEALHELDAIRLDPAGRIAVAYPFSARPTRHRVRIDGRLDVHAMCAIDALGISAMLGAATRIESVDVTSGRRVTVTVPTDGPAAWDPASAVVFLGADAADGPSADRCCDHLNFFSDPDAATAWALAHPHVPGQVLTRTEAEQLGARLFGALCCWPPPDDGGHEAVRPRARHAHRARDAPRGRIGVSRALSGPRRRWRRPPPV